MSFRRLISPFALFPVLAFLGGCSGNWGWSVVNPSSPAGRRNLLFLLDGLYYTIALSVTAILISIILGLLVCLLYTSPSPRDRQKSRMPSSA